MTINVHLPNCAAADDSDSSAAHGLRSNVPPGLCLARNRSLRRLADRMFNLPADYAHVAALIGSRPPVYAQGHGPALALTRAVA